MDCTETLPLFIWSEGLLFNVVLRSSVLSSSPTIVAPSIIKSPIADKYVPLSRLILSFSPKVSLPPFDGTIVPLYPLFCIMVPFVIVRLSFTKQ